MDIVKKLDNILKEAEEDYEESILSIKRIKIHGIDLEAKKKNFYSTNANRHSHVYRSGWSLWYKDTEVDSGFNPTKRNLKGVNYPKYPTVRKLIVTYEELYTVDEFKRFLEERLQRNGYIR